MVAHSVPGEVTRKAAGNGSAESALTLGTIRIVRCIGITWWCIRILIGLLLLKMLRVVWVLRIMLLVVSLRWVLALALGMRMGVVTRRGCTATFLVSRQGSTEERKLTNNPLDPAGYLHRRHRIDRLADHAETLPVEEVHRNSLGPEAHSQRVHCHTEERETDTLVGRDVAGRSPQTGHIAAPATHNSEPEMSS